MTLVVGRVTSDIGFLVADTLLTFEYDLKGVGRLVNAESHVLKIQILNPDTAIAFAGNVTASLKLINNLDAALRVYPRTRVGERLFEIYKQLLNEESQSPPNCDFLVLQLTPEGRKLAHVTHEGVRYCDRAYIGDSVEYKRMTELRRPYCSPKIQHVQQPDGTFREIPLIENEGEIEFAEISNALEELTRQRRRESSVGAICGCVTRVVDARISGKLEYLQSVEVSIWPWEGKSGFTALASNSDKRGIGIYYRAGKLGFLFIVGDSEFCRKEYAETLNQFIAVAKGAYGLDLRGGTWAE
jgi:hypothetical protein